ncbi:Bifunctional trehalose-6-phosphate synthase/phosphatase (Includes: Alpha,alpha-trehalose-phosphate synthase (UDP-forming); Trehalose-6-phosphate phosphatase) [Candidatus Zixiibacteriota bacterium]|nr:Bifunctional trehalose-6-phosphate synthase/phosphatase (Includes: Alpha,alpha-trehalose-phosphate synthase (UDP-forming); Trehalose-6-phosphate phosphatase) [candidate division Zixibacteria bacterium]
MRLIIASNRLPVTVLEQNGRLQYKESAGGLISGLRSYLDSLGKNPSGPTEYIWIGWPGGTISEPSMPKVRERLRSENNSYPVFLSNVAMDKFYHGFCNKTIWPLFHYFPTYAEHEPEYWESYRIVNEAFCRAILEVVQPDDVVWIHDYHLMLLPKLLRERLPQLAIGFFLHIPFPSFEIYRLLPPSWRREILEGLLGADLLGFHTHDYTQYFLRCVLRIIGHEPQIGRIITEDRVIRADTFPMGIDFQKYRETALSSEVQTEKTAFRQAMKDAKVILSIDRLDYSKGIINRLLGYEIFLKNYPQWREKVVLLLVVVPSRIGVVQYQNMKNDIDKAVGKINGRFGTVSWTPINYLYRSLPLEPLLATYGVSDIILVTPLRDGMNLIAKEYIASRTDGKGVLILSEMAGAAKELREAIIMNPNNAEEIAAAISEALDMPESEQVRRNSIMQHRLARYDITRWAEEFIKTLFQVKETQKQFDARLLRRTAGEKLVGDYKSGRRRLIFLDYDGTLVPFAASPEMAAPDQQLLNSLRSLTGESKNEVVLITGRDRNHLEKWFSDIPLNLATEHGAWLKEKDGDWKTPMPLNNDWKIWLLPILETYADRLPGAFIEEKEFSIAWHYRNSDPEQSGSLANELLDDLINLTANINVQILQGKKVLEVRNAGINKGSIVPYWINKDNFDFIMAIGDDWTDEDLFRALPETAYSIRVGMTQSFAKFNLHNYREVRELIEGMIK